MFLAVQQMNGLRYTNVVFLGDCKELIRNLETTVRGGREATITEATTIMKDILALATQNSFSFHHVGI